MLKLKQYDLVRVISFDDEDMIGAEGIIESICRGGVNEARIKRNYK